MSNEKMKDTCEKCKYWIYLKEDERLMGYAGECHHHSPVPFKTEKTASYYAIWCKVKPTDWCGDFEEKELTEPI